MNRLLIVFIVLLLNCSNNAPQDDRLVSAGLVESKAIWDSLPDFDALNDKIRDGLIEKSEALKQLQQLLPELKKYFYEHGGLDVESKNWIFPVQGYSSNAIGGTNGSGFVTNGYDYFDGNKHRGHPAHDIFIYDKNQDCIDDVTKKPVNVLSMTSGIVIATETEWDRKSSLRGGKYIWIYEPYSNSFFYYAHNNSILVKPLDIVTAGDTIATIGRTGLNAFKERSPTHLHIMQLRLDSAFYPRPENCYGILTTARHS